MHRLNDLPLIVILMGIGAAAMMIPAAYGLVVDDHATSRAFFYSSVFFSVIVLMVALATHNMRVRRQGRSHLISILSCFAVLPLMLAVPMAEAMQDTRFINAYFEMLSSLTTTGVSLFPSERLPDTVHLWRGLVGWMGGFLMWVVAIGILSPMTLGGFEISSSSEIGQGARQVVNVADPPSRLRRYGARLFPVYAGLTLILWFALFVAGDRPLVALVHAMSTLSTSGISPVGGTQNAASGHTGEVLIFLFFLFALSRLMFLSDQRPKGWRSLATDPELRLGLFLCLSLALLLFLRHWLVSFEDVSLTLRQGLLGLWGAVFTIMSFLTTTGFESISWEATRTWSGFGAPGVLLLGLAVIGGGVATTAGGVKLLRCYALGQHSVREMQKLLHPSSIGSPGRLGRQFRRQGAAAAWVFFMLFAISIALVMVALSVFGGLNFEETMILTVAALSNTGPLVQTAGAWPVDLTMLNDAARGILCAAMILGRLEALAIIALLNPEFWRS
jgi:trk system potassium uptake protein TrkH